MVARNVELLPEARRDIDGARRWYAKRSFFAARAFVTELVIAVETIREAPERSARYLSGTRRHFLPRFPFSVIYHVSIDTITVVAVAHHRRKPRYWLQRD